MHRERKPLLCILGNFVSAAMGVDRASEQFTNMYEIGGIVQCDVEFHTETG